jgi:hypothetical protein
MFRTTNEPCCSEPFKNNYFSLISGKRLYVTNGVINNAFGDDPGLLRVYGRYDGGWFTQDRYIGFGSDKGSDLEPPAIQYGTDKAITQKLFLVGREYGDNFDVPKLFVTEDGKNLLGRLELKGDFTFTLVLKFPDGPEVRIPIENDVMKADKATLSSGYALRSDNRN